MEGHASHTYVIAVLHDSDQTEGKYHLAIREFIFYYYTLLYNYRLHL